MAQPPPLYPYWNDSQTVLLRKILTNTALIGENIPPGTPTSLVPVPASSASPGALGEFAVSTSYLYVYTTAGWRRTAIDDWS